MGRLIIVAAIAFIAAGCSSSPTTPTQPAPTPEPPPTPTATLVFGGGIAFENCSLVGGGFTCDFSAAADNSGSGCAVNVRGTTKTFRPRPFSTMIGSATFAYGAMIRPGEHFTYRGSGLPVGNEDGGTYTTEFTWDNVRCP